VARKTVANDSAADLKRVTIRMPYDLHAALIRRREETGRSLNDLMVEATARLVGVSVPQLAKGVPGPRPKRTRVKK
jgi:hypothetical protein